MKTCRLFLVSFLIVAMSMLTGWRSHRHHKKHHVELPPAESSEPKKLDLSMPLKESDNADKITTPKSELPIEKTKKIHREVELGTEAIMFPYPEQGKAKSFDGAGITINVKP